MRAKPRACRIDSGSKAEMGDDVAKRVRRQPRRDYAGELQRVDPRAKGVQWRRVAEHRALSPDIVGDERDPDQSRRELVPNLRQRRGQGEFVADQRMSSGREAVEGTLGQNAKQLREPAGKATFA